MSCSAGRGVGCAARDLETGGVGMCAVVLRSSGVPQRRMSLAPSRQDDRQLYLDVAS